MTGGEPEPSYLAREGGERLAYLMQRGKEPGIVWLGGFKSEMRGNKASRLDEWAARTGRAYVRFDYFGHGQSSGDFRDGTVSRWRDDALAVIDKLTAGPLVLVGSSMGAWVALLAALARKERIAGLLLIAPATDFTETLLWRRFPDDAKRALLRDGEFQRPSAYDPEPYPITRALIEDGRKHLLLESGSLPLNLPVRILQGMRDPDVPWSHAVKLMEALSGDAHLIMVREGDHRLSTDADLGLMVRELEALIADIAT